MQSCLGPEIARLIMSGEDEPTSSASSRKGKGRAPPDEAAHEASEVTPLLERSETTSRYDGDQSSADGDAAQDDQDAPQSSARSPSRSSSVRSKKTALIGWPSIVAITTLMALIIAIMLGAFFVPAALQDYTKHASILEPTNLSLESITATGVRARIQAEFRLDGSRVEKDSSRRVGRIAGWMFGKLGTDETIVSVYLPEHDNILLGTAAFPPLTLDVVDGHSTPVDLVTELALGDTDGVREVANTWLDGKLKTVKCLGKADVTFRSGGLPLGTYTLVDTFFVEGQSLYLSFAAYFFGEKFFW